MAQMLWRDEQRGSCLIRLLCVVCVESISRALKNATCKAGAASFVNVVERGRDTLVDVGK